MRLATRLGLILLAFQMFDGMAVLAAQPAYPLFARTNLLAWCIVPFDAKKRGPEERAAMLERLGFSQFAYDYRVEHIPSFDAEVDALQRHHIRLRAWWFPTELNDEAKLILEVLKRHHLTGVQLWVMGGGEPTRSAAEQNARVELEAQRIGRIARAADSAGSAVGLYNHGGWFGEPENQLNIIARLSAQGVTNVGIVYNLHHAHHRIARFEELLRRMKPHLLALNLNGMSSDPTAPQILPVGRGNLDLKMLRTIVESGWRGPIGLLNHTDEDAEIRLSANLAGLERLVTELPTSVNPPRPVPAQ